MLLLLIKHLGLDLAIHSTIVVLIGLCDVSCRLLGDLMLHMQERTSPLHIRMLLLISRARVRVQTTARLGRLTQEVARVARWRETVSTETTYMITRSRMQSVTSLWQSVAICSLQLIWLQHLEFVAHAKRGALRLMLCHELMAALGGATVTGRGPLLRTLIGVAHFTEGSVDYAGG